MNSNLESKCVGEHVPSTVSFRLLTFYQGSCTTNAIVFKNNEYEFTMNGPLSDHLV